MKNQKQAIDKILSSIDWKKIKSYHTKLGIKWEIEIDKQLIKRIPSVPELRDDLSSILHHMVEKELDYMSYGSWIIFWINGDIRVVFRLADFSFEDSKMIKEADGKELEEALQKAIDNENYEYAAVIRDEINNIKKSNANHNIK